MTHAIQGLILARSTVDALAVDHVHPVPLTAAGLAFVPMTDALFDHLRALFPTTTGGEPPEFWKLSAAGVAWLERVSAAGPVAYVETEYFGGHGDQAAGVWESGRITFGPRRAHIGPINEALKRLGVNRTEKQDEFDVAGLGRYRRTDDWRR